MSGSGTDRAERDLALVRRCLAGDDDAWRRVIEEYRPRMIELAERVLPLGAAADVVDAVIADLWERRKLERYEGRSALATWLGAVAINAALNARRATAVRPERTLPGDHMPDVASPMAPPNEHADLGQILSDAVAALPPDAKLLVLMYYEQQLTLDDAAALFGRSKSTLSRMLTKARQMIAAEADRLSLERLRMPLAALRAGADLATLDLDLQAACAGSRDGTERGVSKE
jgi:RNA polymerase sigma-70 factor, ECF subfamily